MQEIELKPCPFCGGEVFIHTIEPHKHIFAEMPDYKGGAFVECKGCNCCMSADTESEAIEVWNRRV